MVHYKGKLALITGASSGIGKVYAEELAAKGSHVILTARSKDKLEVQANELAEKYGIQAYALASDLSKPGAARRLAEQITALGLSVHILINNAGFGTYGRFEDISSDREQEEIMLNIASLVELTHQFLPEMVQKKDGIIVNVASLAAFQPGAYMAVYCASKAFVLSFTEALWAENRNSGVRILALCPGATQTDFFNTIGTTDAAGGTTLSTPMKVVQAGFRGIEQGRSYIIEGTTNYLAAQSSRFFPRKMTASIMERMTRPKSSNASS
jgi:short-subunit dehydrogenase